MNDLPASWAHLGPYLFVAAAAVAVVAAAVEGRRGGGPVRQPAPAVVGDEAARLWRVSPPWEPALRVAGSATRRVSRDPLLPATIGLAAFGLAIGRQPLVVFLGLFIIPTVALAPGVFRGRGGLATFISFAAADLSLVLGMMHRHAATGMWTTPAPGHVGAGALLVAVAAGLRLGSPAGGPDFGSKPALTQAGWFQGLFLAWWLGPSAGTPLALVALALGVGGAALARRGRQESGLLFAGALAALLAGLGAGPATVAAVGLAGTAFTMGDRAVSMGTLALAPLSAPAVSGITPALHPWMPAALGLFVLAVATALHHLLRLPPIPTRSRLLPAVAAAAITAVVLAVRGAETAVWAAYGLGLAGVVAARAVRPGTIDYGEEFPEDARGAAEDLDGELAGLGSVREAALATLGAALLVVALLMVGELTITGLRTNFL